MGVSTIALSTLSIEKFENTILEEVIIYCSDVISKKEKFLGLQVGMHKAFAWKFWTFADVNKN